MRLAAKAIMRRDLVSSSSNGGISSKKPRSDALRAGRRSRQKRKPDPTGSRKGSADTAPKTINPRSCR